MTNKGGLAHNSNTEDKGHMPNKNKRDKERWPEDHILTVFNPVLTGINVELI